MTRREPRDRDIGQSLAEFALFVPVLALILVMAVDLGRAYLSWVTLNNVARIGANYAAQNPEAWLGSGNATVQSKYRTLMTKDARSVGCNLPGSWPDPNFADSSHTIGSRVTVDLSCDFVPLTPLLSDLIGGPDGDIEVSASAVFVVRFGSFDSDTVFNGGAWGTPAPDPTPTPTTAPPAATPTPTPTATPTATPTPDPSVTPGPTAAPTPTPAPTPQPPVISFYGTPTSADSYGGGPPGSVDEGQVVGIPNLAVTFTNTTTGTQGNCTWNFGDGATTNACSETVTHTYTSRGTYTVSLEVDGYVLTRTDYVLVTCKVPAFAGVRKNNATSTWTSAGFASGNISFLPGNGNYKIGFQSLVGGLVNPPGGCGASIQVGP